MADRKDKINEQQAEQEIREEIREETKPPIKEKTNMKIRMTRPVTAIRLRIKRLATSIPGERTLTRRSSFRE